MSLHGVTVIWILTLIFRLEAREQQKNILHLWSHELSYARLTFLWARGASALALCTIRLLNMVSQPVVGMLVSLIHEVKICFYRFFSVKALRILFNFLLKFFDSSTGVRWEDVNFFEGTLGTEQQQWQWSQKRKEARHIWARVMDAVQCALDGDTMCHSKGENHVGTSNGSSLIISLFTYAASSLGPTLISWKSCCLKLWK